MFRLSAGVLWTSSFLLLAEKDAPGHRLVYNLLFYRFYVINRSLLAGNYLAGTHENRLLKVYCIDHICKFIIFQNAKNVIY
jgi:hypothetical protein